MTTYNSPSKINLYLRIAGKLPNGYHEIETVFLPLNTPSDRITVKENKDGISLSCAHSGVPEDSRNICWKAVEAYSQAIGKPLALSMDIVKEIPVAAGMGGGSSNAATVLNALNDTYNAMSDEELAECALQLGADVPFFLNPTLSTASGVGEKLIPVEFDYQPLPLVIVAPHFPVSAAWAYKHCSVSEDSSAGDMIEMLEAVKAGDLRKVASLVRNDLAIPLYKKFPFLSILKDDLLEAGALCAEVTGSGPTMFAIASNENEQQKIAQIIREKLPETMSVYTT